MKIAYIANHIPVPSETFIVNEIIAQESLGADIYPISLYLGQTCHADLMSKIKRHPFVLSCGEHPQNGATSAFFPQATQMAKDYGLTQSLAIQACLVGDHINAHGIEHIHAHFATDPALVAFLASELTSTPFSFTAHAYDIFIDNKDLPKGCNLKERLKLLTGKASRVITISDFNKEHINVLTDNMFSDKIEVIHCGVDFSKFQLADRPIKTQTNFLSVGRFVEKKGHEYLIRSFAKAASVLPDARLRIVGDGPLRGAMIELCKELNILDKVEFLGSASSEEVRNKLIDADIFVLHSVTATDGDREGVPVSLMEASATGLPIVATRHSGIPDLVLDGSTGFLSEERDIESFADLMIKLGDSPSLRKSMGMSGYEHVRKHFNLGTETKKLYDLFYGIGSANRPYGHKDESMPFLNLDEQTIDSKSPKLSDLDTSKSTFAPFCSVIIPVYNASSTLAACLESISQLDYPKDKLEIIVVDNGSTDSSVEIAQKFKIVLLFETSVQSSYAARNKGISEAKGELIAFTDSDCVVTPGWLKFLVSAWEDQAVGCFAGEIEAYQPSSVVEIFSQREGLLRQSGTFNAPYLPYPQTANACYRKTVFNQVGLFVPEMTSGGDADLAWRMQKRLGLKIRFVPEALVYHKHRTDLQGLYNQFRKYEIGKVFLKQQYPDYPYLSVEERKREYEYSIWHLYDTLKRNILPLAKDKIDFVDLVSPFLKLLMHAGTFKARVEIDQASGAFTEAAITDTPSFISEEEGEYLKLSSIVRSQEDRLLQQTDSLLQQEDRLLQQEDRLMQKDGLLLQQEEALHQRSEELKEVRLANVQLQAELELKQQRVDDLHNSISWKLTAPLRRIVDMATGRKGPG